MGLDMYLEGIKDYENYKKIKEKANNYSEKCLNLSSVIWDEFEKLNKYKIEDWKKKDPELKDVKTDRIIMKALLTLTKYKLQDGYNTDAIEWILFNEFPIYYDSDNKKEKTQDFIKMAESLRISDSLKANIEEFISNLGELEKLKDMLEKYEESIVVWRKAYLINHWFLVNHCDNDMDKCSLGIMLDYEAIRELRETCKKVIDIVENAVDDVENFNLPKDSEAYRKAMGLFLVDTEEKNYELDDWCFKKIKKTYEELSKLDKDSYNRYIYSIWY